MPPSNKTHLGRILYFVNVDTYFLSHRLSLAQAAQGAGYEIHVVSAEGVARREIEAHGFTFHAIRFNRSGVNPIREAQALWDVLRLVRKVQPSIIHNLTLKPTLYGTFAALAAPQKVKVVNLVAGLGSLFSNNSMRTRFLRTLLTQSLRVTFHRSHAQVIVQNEDDLKVMVDRKIVASKNASLIRGSGVDTKRFAPSPKPDRPSLVVLPSRLLKAKGVEDFVASARRLKGEGLQARFALVGTPDSGNRDSVAPSDVEAWKSEGAVEVWGWRDDMPQVFASADIVCLPTRYREGVPKSLIDAASCGLPLVTTDTPGCRDIVRNGVNGYTFEVGDSVALDEALRTLIADPELRIRMGEESRQLAERAFSEDIVIAQTLQLYERPLAGLKGINK